MDDLKLTNEEELLDILAEIPKDSIDEYIEEEPETVIHKEAAEDIAEERTEEDAFEEELSETGFSEADIAEAEAAEAESESEEKAHTGKPSRKPGKARVIRKPTRVTRILQVLLPALVLIWDEVLFHVYVNEGIHDSSILYIALFGLAIGLVYAAMAALLPDLPATILGFVSVSILTLLFITQTFYQRIFDDYLTLSVMGNAGDAKEFWRAGVKSLWARMPLVVLLLVPIVLYIVLRKKGFRHEKFHTLPSALPIVGACLAVIIAFSAMNGAKAHENGRFEVFFEEWQSNRGIRENGILVGMVQDMYHMATYDPDKVGDVVLDVNPLPSIPPVATKAPTTPATPEPTRAPNHTPTPTPTPVDRSPHTLDIDFAALAEQTNNQAIKTIHQYMANTEPVNKNEYTGMFEGYNLIMLTCETFSPLAVSRERTPTLYKLVHSGFYFDNFYTPYWITSTSDGEYTVCTGLLPDTQMSNSFSRSANNNMAGCLGHIFRGMGYTTYAFHNHDNRYYDRHLSHPNMGYTFIAKWAGLNVTNQFPESDLEMMELTIPKYINEEHFHAYYMTMSGHMTYEWENNAMGRKHRNEVRNLPYSEEAKCYLAGNIELENALKYLIEQLTAAGKMDNTLIVLTGDHYPYGLTEAQRNELAGHKIEKEFELYKNHLVIWNPSIEPQTISKAACSLDVMPTILNLLGIEYDSRLYMGTDIFSDSLGLVQFKDNSFLTDYVRYNANNGQAEWLNGAQNWDADTKKQYIDSYKTIVKNKFNISRAMLNNNYYATIDKYLWWKHPELKASAQEN